MRNPRLANGLGARKSEKDEKDENLLFCAAHKVGQEKQLQTPGPREMGVASTTASPAV
jgi:hypothetical protein